ncbi:MAG TPA: acyl-CoA dehydrogenase family protein [Kofleriaceae bacterium]|nr:acyl-CoA dehydrogenase family protein [Kofleriaceae bacterium]
MYRFTDEHKMIRKMVRRWATEKLEPRLDALEAGEPPYELMREFARTFGIPDMVRGAFAKMEQRAAEGGGKPVRMGGIGGGDPAMSMLLSIELSRVSPGFMLAFGASMGLAGGAIMGKGTLEQKKRWGLPIMTWDKIGAWGMTEPGAGSDAFRSMRTVAVPTSDGYRLSGQKTFITNAPYADIIVVYAKIDRGDGTPLGDRPIQAFVLEKGDAGLEVSAPMRKMGMHSSPTGEVFLQDCIIPADRLLGVQEKETVGRASGKDVFHSERTGMAPMCVGIIERCLEISLAYARERVTWGKKIAEYQLVQEKLARMYMHLQNCENLMFKQLALTADGHSMSAAEASATKLYCARAATEVALEAVQILGGNGYMQEYRVEMLMRDAKLLQIGGGTDEIQIINIARHLLASDALA